MSNIQNQKAELELEAVFQNKDFEKNISQTMNSLDEFEKSLNNFGGQSVKGIEKLNQSFDSLSNTAYKLVDTGEFIQRRFSILGTAIYNKMADVVGKVIDGGARMLKAFSVDQISAGWEKFADNTKNIGTIISQGYNMDEVEEQMKRLMFFTDETSYNYNDMVGNISKFTAAGQTLKDAVQEMQGIALWAGSAGSNAQKASQAMYQLSQAMGAGYMRKEDWKSIQTLNMDTVEFRKIALETAVELGRLKKTGEDTYESLVNPKAGEFKVSQFAEHLTHDKWFDSTVMKRVYSRYSEAVNQIYDYVQKNGVTATQAIEELDGKIDPLALKWFKASQEARTFGDAIEYVKEAVSTGWLKTFQIIFGNYEEATKLWTDFSEVLYTVFVQINETRNEILELWKDMNGRDELLLGVSEAFKTILSFIEPVKEAFRTVFPEESLHRSANTLYEITKAFTDLMVSLRLSDDSAALVKEAFIGIFSAVKAVIRIVKTFIGILIPMADPLNLLLGLIADLMAQFGKSLTDFSEWVGTSAEAKGKLDEVATAIRAVVIALAALKVILPTINTIGTSVKNVRATVVTLLGTVRTVVGTVKGGVAIIKALIPLFFKLGIAAAVFYGIHRAVLYFFGSWENAINSLRKNIGIAVDFFKNIGHSMSEFFGSLIPKFQNAKASISDFFSTFSKNIELGNKIDFLRTKFDYFYKNALNFASITWHNAKDGFSSLVAFLQSAFTDLPGTINLAKEEIRKFFDYTNPESGISKAIVTIQSGITQLGNMFNQAKQSVVSFFVGLYEGIRNSELLKSIQSGSGIKGFIDSFHGIETVTGLLNRFAKTLNNIALVISPKFGVVGQIVGKIFSDLSKIFSNLSSNFNFRGVVTTLIDLFMLLGNTIQNVISKIIPPLATAATAVRNFFNSILSRVGGLDGAMKTVGSALGIAGSSMDRFKGSSSGAMVAANGFFKLIGQGIKGIQQGFSEFAKETGTEEFFHGVAEWLKPIIDYIKQLKPSQVLLFVFGMAVTRFAIAFSSAMVKITNSVDNVIKSANKVVETVDRISTTVEDTVKGVKATVTELTTAVKKLPEAITTGAEMIKKAILGHNMAKNFLRVAAGITMLAVSFGLLAKFVKPEELAKVAAIIGVFMMAMVYAIKQLGTIDAAAMAGKAAVMLSLAVSLALIAATIGIISKDMDPDKLSRLTLGLGMVGLIAFLTYQALKMFATIPVNAAAAVGPILALSVAINLIAMALAVLIPVVSLVGIGGTLGALGILGAFLVGIATIADIAGSISAKAFLPILGITASLYLLLGAILLIAISPLSFDLIKKNWEKFAIMFGVVALILIGIGATVRLAGNAIKGIGLGFIAIAVGLNQITKAMNTVANMPFDKWGTVFKSIIVFVVLFIAFTDLIDQMAGTKATKGMIRFGVAMIALAVAMRVMVVVMEAIRALTEKTTALQMGGILLVFVIISAVIAGLMYVSKYTRTAKLGPIVVLIGAIGLLMVAVALMSQLPNLPYMIGLAVGLAVFFAGIGYCFKQVGIASKRANTGVMAAFAAIVVALCFTLGYLAQQEWQKVAAAGGAIAVAAAGIGLGIYLIGQAAKAANGALTGAGAIVLASLSLVAAAGALLILKDYPVENLAVKALALGTIFAIMAVASQYATLGLVGAGALVIASASLAVAAFSLMLLKDFPADTILPAALALSSILVGLAFAATFASVAVLGAVALDLAAGSLILAALSLSMLSDYPAAEVSQNAMSLIMVLVALAGAGMLASLPNVAFGLVAVSAAMLAFAVSVAVIASAAGTFADAVERVIGSVTSLADVSEENMTRITDNMNAIGSAVGSSIANAITSFFSSLYRTIDEATGGIFTKLLGAADRLAAAKTRFTWVGGELNAGLTTGIQNSGNLVETAISTLGNKLLETFQNIVGVHSESSVFHWIGEMLGLGLENGIDGSSGAVAASMKGLGASVIDAAKGYFNYDTGLGLAGNLLNGIKAGLSGIPGLFRNVASGAGTHVKAFLGDEEAKAELELKRWNRQAVTEQERLEKEMHKVWNPDKETEQENPFENLFPDDPGGGGGGGGGGSDAAEKTEKTAKEIDKFTNILDYASEAVGKFNTRWALGMDDLSSTDAFKVSTDAIELLALQLYEASIASETAEEAAERMAKTQAEVAADIKKAYLDVRDGIAKTLQGQIDLFSMADFGDKKKGGDLLEMARSQDRLATHFEMSFNTLTERVAGLQGAEKLLKHFTDEGYSSMGDLSSILDMTSEELQEFVGLADKYYGTEVYEHAANGMMSNMAYIAQQAAGGFQQGFDPETGEAAADSFATATLNKLREKFGVNLQGDNSSEVTRAIGEGLAKGITDSLGGTTETNAAVTEGEKLGSNITDALGTSVSEDSGVTIGKSLCEGIAKGIRENAYLAVDAATELGVGVAAATNGVLKINSPSKVFEDTGYYSDLGLANGLIRNAHVVREAAVDVGNTALNSLSGVFGQIADFVDNSMNLNPTITPVLDLTNLQYGSGMIGSLLGIGDPYALNAVARVNSTAQNNANLLTALDGSFRTAINALKNNGDQQPVQINIYTQPGQSAEEIANYVAWKFSHDLNKRRAAYGGA